MIFKLKKVIAINGSPHGKGGNTIFYFQYAQKQFPDVDCKIFHVGAHPKKIEEDQNYFNSIIDEIKDADAIFWIFPTWPDNELSSHEIRPAVQSPPARCFG